MPRPTSKKDLLVAIEKERGALEGFLETLTTEEMIETNIVGIWSVKDTLAHLIEWEQMCLGWYNAGLQGETPSIPAEGYKWNQTPQLNQYIYKKQRDRPLGETLEQFHESHREILEVIQGLSNEKLFTSGVYAWTKKNTLGAYMVSATSSHYLWARREIKKGLKAKQKIT